MIYYGLVSAMFLYVKVGLGFAFYSGHVSVAVFFVGEAVLITGFYLWIKALDKLDNDQDKS